MWKKKPHLREESQKESGNEGVNHNETVDKVLTTSRSTTMHANVTSMLFVAVAVGVTALGLLCHVAGSESANMCQVSVTRASSCALWFI